MNAPYASIGEPSSVVRHAPMASKFYLSTNYQAQHLYNRTWALLASTRLTRVVTDTQRDALIDDLVRAQRGDGGWSLTTMGPWKWSKTAPPVKAPRRSRCGALDPVRRLRHRPRGVHVEAGWRRSHSRRGS
jgi:hypothetical protein